MDNQNTLKRYFRDDENKKIILHPENKKMKDIIVDECCIQGVACHIIKNYNRGQTMRTLEGIRYLINLDSAEANRTLPEQDYRKGGDIPIWKVLLAPRMAWLQAREDGRLKIYRHLQDGEACGLLKSGYS